MEKPSKQVTAVLIISISIILGALLIKYKPFSSLTFTSEKSPEIKDLTVGTGAQNTIEIDSDEDGLKDWEEILWKSDSKNKDSDNDGTNDGDEVKQGRNPMIKGPNDKNTEESGEGSFLKTGGNGTSEENISQKFTTAFLSDFTYLESTGNLNNETKTQLIQKFTEGADGAFPFKKYDLSSLSVDLNPTQEELKFYATTIATLQTNTLVSISKSSPLIERDLDVMADIYKKLMEDFLAVQNVPSVLAPAHLQIINNYSASSEAFRALKRAKDDPIKASLAMNVYKSLGDLHYALLLKMAKYFNENGIIFNDEEIGSYWTIILNQESQ